MVNVILHGAPLAILLGIPAIVPATVSAYAVVGERQQGTLEPALTTPIRRTINCARRSDDVRRNRRGSSQDAAVAAVAAGGSPPARPGLRLAAAIRAAAGGPRGTPGGCRRRPGAVPAAAHGLRQPRRTAMRPRTAPQPERTCQHPSGPAPWQIRRASARRCFGNQVPRRPAGTGGLRPHGPPPRSARRRGRPPCA